MEFVRESRHSPPPMPVADVRVKEPPQIPKAVPINPMARIMPVAMVVAAAGMMAVYLTSGAASTRNPMYLLFPVMMVSSVLGTLAYGGRGARSGEIDNDRGTYLRYLDSLDSEIIQFADDQRRFAQWRHPAPENLWTLVGGPRMWERTSEDADFCVVRVGRGCQPLSARLIAPDLGPGDESDPVTTGALQRLIGERSLVGDLPVAVALRACTSVTIEGDAETARALLRALICQLAVLHGPDHLAIAAVVDASTAAAWDWLKWLPHHQHAGRVDSAGTARCVHADVHELLCIATPFEGIASRRHVVIVDKKRAGDDDGVVVADNVTILGIGAMAGNGIRLRIDDDGTLIVPGDEMVQPDPLTLQQATLCARRLAPYRLAAERDRGTTGWLALMGVDDPRRLDPDTRWEQSKGGHILPVPIGAGADGVPIHLDINEAARNGVGPHGLCVGATGSGKSEFLRTLALGMITLHSPDVVNLILVDFKGGATFLGLERARHVAAVITNLADEAHLVSRMNAALAGEMNRRQELLRAAGNFANVVDYERARARGAALPPLPALFIIVDEFSELLSQHPDFAELFVAIGRLGRSLGMHLLLASQRLDEGRLRGLDTHLSYRICLKTFSASESRAVLGVPDAYHLPGTPGAAFLKTSHDDLVRFQTAFVSGPDRAPAPTPEPSPRSPVLFTAAPVGDIRDVPDAADRHFAQVRTLMDVVVDRLADRGRPAHAVWLPPLTQSPTLDALRQYTSGRTLTAPIGLVDCPFEQRREVFDVDLAGAAGNVVVVGAPQSGKSTTVRTLLMALAEVHAPTDIAFYCLDFGGGGLSSMARLPHVGSVAGGLDADLCRRTVAVIQSLLRAREETFRKSGIDSMAAYRRRRAIGDPSAIDDPYGDVFLVIDGWSTLRQDFESLEAPITAIAARGLSYGVHVVVTASRWAELRPALKDQIGTRIELRLGDPTDSEMDRKSARQLVGRPAGRGIRAGGSEMVIALPRWDGKPTAQGLGDAVNAHAEQLCGRWRGRRVPPVQLLPTRLAYRDLVGRSDTAGQPVIGIGESELAAVSVDFVEHPHLLILGDVGCGKTSALRLLCREITRTADAEKARLEIVDFRRTLLGVVESDHLAGYAMSPASLASRLRVVSDMLDARMPPDNITQHELRTRSWWSGPEIYLVIDDYDLAAGATGNPMTPLADYLPHAKDLGLHFIVARRSGGAARAMFDPILARLRELGCMGLMMSASPDEGVLIGSVRPSPLPPGRGTLVTRGEPDQIIQVAWTDTP
jgi:DNA segregation ATPase FtsK/SpoIIIE, S-DNA-T family